MMMSHTDILVARLRKSLILVGTLICFASFQVSADSEETEFLTTAETDGFKLELVKRGGRCEISLNDGKDKKVLGVPHPCGFVRADDGLKAQWEHYEDVGYVFIVAGPLTCNQTYEYVSAEPSMKCSDHGQAVIVNKGELSLRPKRHVPALFCHHRGFDEKDYFHYAYPDE